MILKENVSLAPFTTLRIGGPARYFIEVNSEDELVDAIAFSDTKKLPVFVLGGGSNLVVSDHGFSGLVIKMGMRGVEWDEVITVQADEAWDELVFQCIERNLAGVECMSGIPGSVGAAPIQNIGAYGQEVSDSIVAVRVYDREEKRIHIMNNSDCVFGYRSSIFNTVARDRYIVLTVSFKLKEYTTPTIHYPDLKKRFADFAGNITLRDIRNAVLDIRAGKSMLIKEGDPDSKSAGSFFKNPVITEEQFKITLSRAVAKGVITSDDEVPHFIAPNGYVKIPAAWLIEHAGFHKGYQSGCAAISSKHTLALVNKGGATSSELLDLANEIRAGVLDAFGVALHFEPVMIGD